jgi:hypothetical protein
MLGEQCVRIMKLLITDEPAASSHILSQCPNSLFNILFSNTQKLSVYCEYMRWFTPGLPNNEI